MRLVDLDQQSLATLTKGLTDDLIRLKSLQRIGSDGVKTFRVMTDFITIDTDPTDPASFLRMFKVIFTPDDTSLKNGLAFKMVAVQQRTFTDGTRLIDQSSYFSRAITGSSNVQIWNPNSNILIFDGDGRQMKFYCFTTAPGTISIEYI